MMSQLLSVEEEEVEKAEESSRSQSIFSSWVKRKKIFSRSKQFLSPSRADSSYHGNTTKSSKRSSFLKRSRKGGCFISRDLFTRRSFEVKKDVKSTSRFTPQCQRLHLHRSGTIDPRRDRAKSFNTVDENVISDEEDDGDNDDVFEVKAYEPRKPVVRNHIHPKHKTKSISSGCISNESGYGTMTRKNATLRPAEIEDEDVFLQSNATRLSNGDFPNDDGVYVEALWDHVTMDTEELGFKVGDVIRVIDLSNADWWWGELDSKEGWFPATFVRILVNQHRDDSDSGEVISARNDDDNQSISSHEFNRVTCFGDECCQCPDPVETSEMSCEKCGKPVTSNSADRCANAPDSQEHPEIVISSPTSFNSRKSLHARDRIRKNVINEIVNSEKVFVGHLKDVIEGYLTRCRKRPDMFTDQQISTLFGNIEDIFHFQIKFAAELEAAVDRSAVHSTHLGEVFLNHKSGFAIYSEYCNNHPQALSLLSEMLSGKKYIHFLEACRLLQKMIDISLDGFLLTPVQKICKYPLQLAELLKYTNPEHPDYEPVKSALDTMKGVARMINERKRRMENIKKISLWQSTIVNWQGDDVLVRSSELVHSGDVYSVSKSKKSKIRMAFLFDHQMILCKKDLLRRDLFYYKTRIDLDHCDVNPLEGESPRVSSSSGEWTSTSSQNGQQGWRITDRESGEKTLMLCKSEEDMARWMKAFAFEREMSLARNDDLSLVHDSLLKGALANLLVSPRKPKETSMSRAPSYRYRMKMAQELNQSKHKGVSSGEKSGSFFSNVAGKLTPFRRQAVRESGLAF